MIRNLQGILLLFLVVLGILLAGPSPASAENGGTSDQPQPTAIDSPASADLPGKLELEFEFDAYYTNVGLFIPLAGQTMCDLGERDETDVYRDLLRNLASPRFMLLEAAVFPMPLVGTYLKKNHRDFYNGAGNGNFNFIESITAGFREPYALSFFFGDVVRFTKKGEDSKTCNKGYMGIMVSYAPQHIKNNELIDDNNFELEWKLKGDRIFNDENLSWSFRLGTKIHDNSDIANVGYVGLRRSNIDFNADILSWLKNSRFEVKWDIGLRDGKLLRQEYIVGKSFPLKKLHVALTIDTGLIWESSDIYSGSLRNADFHNYIFVLRPNIKF